MGAGWFEAAVEQGLTQSEFLSFLLSRIAAQVRMLSTLQQYDAIFQTPFLDASRRYYQAVGIQYQAEVRANPVLQPRLKRWR